MKELNDEAGVVTKFNSPHENPQTLRRGQSLNQHQENINLSLHWQATKAINITLYKNKKTNIYKSRLEPEYPAGSKGLTKTKLVIGGIVTHEG